MFKRLNNLKMSYNKKLVTLTFEDIAENHFGMQNVGN